MKRVLVVDDEEDVRTYLTRLFEESGYEVDCAANGAEALEKTLAARPSLVTLDLSMPETSGVRFYKDVKTRPDLAGIPVVMVTGVTGPGGNAADTERFYSTRRNVPPPEGFVAKPIDREEILALVRRLIG